MPQSFQMWYPAQAHNDPGVAGNALKVSAVLGALHCSQRGRPLDAALPLHVRRPLLHLISSMRTVLHVMQACLLNLHSAFMCWSVLSTVSYSSSARPVRYFPYVINKGAAKFRCMPPCSE